MPRPRHEADRDDGPDANRQEADRQDAFKRASQDTGENTKTGVDLPAPGTGPTNTEQARAQSREVLRQQEQNKPVPSQEEADEAQLRSVSTASGAAYQNRAARSA